SAAGNYALETFPPQWAPIVREALALRHGERAGRFANPWARRRAMLAYMELVMADALGEGLRGSVTPRRAAAAGGPVGPYARRGCARRRLAATRHRSLQDLACRAAAAPESP